MGLQAKVPETAHADTPETVPVEGEAATGVVAEVPTARRESPRDRLSSAASPAQAEPQPHSIGAGTQQTLIQ